MINILRALMVTVLVVGSPAASDTPDDPLRFFANCAGRLSAELSHRWMLADPSASDIEALRAAMLDVLEALTPEDAGRDVLSWRVAARSAHSALLSRASLRGDPWAGERAAQELAHCAAFVVGPISPVESSAEPFDLPPVSAALR